MQFNCNLSGKLEQLLGSLADVEQTGDRQWQARCPAHDDNRPSLSVSILDDVGKIGVHCHANCASSEVLAAVGMRMSDLMPPHPSHNGKIKGKIVAAYDYRDVDGALEFQVVRFEPKDFRQRRPKDGGGWDWKVRGCKLLPYRLPELAAADPSQSVYVVEGEKDVDRLRGIGLVATCNAGGAGKWRKQHANYLAGRSVVILPDNDNAGRDHAQKVARSLVGKASSIKIVTLSGLPDNGDVSDWLDNGGTVDKLVAVTAAQDEWTPEPTKPKAGKDSRDDEEEDKRSTADKLVELALARYRIGRKETDDAFAVEIGGPNVALMFRGSRDALRSALARAYRLEHGKVPNSSALADAMTALQGEAFVAEPEQVYLRVAEYHGKIIVDLGDATGKAIVISPGDWQIVDRSPVLFRRTAATGVLPEPERGADLSELRGLLNVTAETWPLAIGWLVAGLVPNMPHPILLLGGQQGTGKTTGAKKLIGVLDPSPADVRSNPRNVEMWAITAAGSWAVAIDNVSAIPDWWSDSLCKAVTGDGWLRRKLYTDDELAVLSFRRVILLTSIDPGALRGDLGDRILLVDLEPIDETTRRAEQDIDAEYEAARPRIFGSLLDLLAKVLAELPRVKLNRLPRMADFGRLLAAMDVVLADDAGNRALDIYLGQRERIAETVIESDQVALAIRSLLDEVGQWEGTAAELLAKITPEKLPKDWPSTPQSLGGPLRRLMPALEQAGIAVTKDREGHNRTRKYHLEKRCKDSSASSALSAPPENYGKISTNIADDHADKYGQVDSACPPTCPHELSANHEENTTADNADNADNLLQPLSAWGEV